MILITSGAYVNSEFRIEFGLLPPAFLPVGNRRLFEWQVSVLKKQFPGEKIVMTVPNSYSIALKDIKFFEKSNVELLITNQNLSLGEAIAEFITRVPLGDDCLRILHGDTLLDVIPAELDLIATGNTKSNYDWEVEELSSGFEEVWIGYFAFSRPNELYKYLRQLNASFVGSVKKYMAQYQTNKYFIDGWYDFGHINTYFQSRAKLTTERSFNSLQIVDGCIQKTGTDTKKILAEASWYKNLPSKIRIFSPQLIDSGSVLNPYYSIEYLPIPPLNEIFVHGNNPVFFWDKIFGACSEYFQKCAFSESELKTEIAVATGSQDLIDKKTKQRLNQFFDGNEHIDWDTVFYINQLELPSLNSIFDHCVSLANNITAIPGVLHGDFCLSNILFDSRSDRIKVIDPRGLNGLDEESIYGDISYDLAKLTHSIIGLYDHIISGAYALEFIFQDRKCLISLEIYANQNIKEIQNIFLNRDFIQGITPIDVMPLTVLLFLAMLPLHADDTERQLALLANALRLYSIYLDN